MKKRLMALCLLLAMLVAMLAGCGETAAEPTQTPGENTGDVQNTPEPTPVETGVTYPLVDEPVYLTIQGSINPDAVSYIESRTDVACIQEAGKRTGVYLEFTDVPGPSAREQFNIMIGTGDYPDIIGDFKNYYTAGLDNGIEEEIIIDLLPYLDEYAPDYKNAVIKYAGWAAAVTDGGRVGNFGGINDEPLQDQGMLIRKDWLDELELEVPQTYDELHDVLSAFVTEKGSNGPMFMSAICTVGQQLLSTGYGIAVASNGSIFQAPFYVVDGEVKCGWVADEFKNYMLMQAKWYEEGLIYKDFASVGNAYMARGNKTAAPSIYDGTLGYFYGEMNDISILAADGIEVIGIPDIVLNEGDLSMVSTNGKMGGITNGVSISTACKEPELAISYFNYWYTDEGSLLGSYGIEGESFEYVDGKPMLTDLVLNNPDNIPVKACLNIYCMETWTMIQMRSRDKQSYNEELLAYNDVWLSNRTAERYYPYAMATMNAEENAVYSEHFTELATYVQECMAKMTVGEMDIEAEWDNYIAQCEALGVAECVASKQGAYNRYLDKMAASAE